MGNKEVNKKYYLKNKEAINLRNRLRYGRDRLLICIQRRGDLKMKARYLANKKIKIPKGQLCVACNLVQATERHHEDHAKPLDVKFVCHSCNCILK